MARKKAKYEKPEITRQADYYKLKTQAVQDLVTADESNSPPVSEAELRKYQSGPKFKVADWVKYALIKIWFPGAVCFFFIWGLGESLGGQAEMLLVTGVALGIVTDLLTNSVLRFMEKVPGGNSGWMMFPKKAYYTFPMNILYSFVVLALVYLLYTGINMLAAQVTGNTDTVFLGVEPVLFGVFYFAFDSLLIRIKQLFLRWLTPSSGKLAGKEAST